MTVQNFIVKGISPNYDNTDTNDRYIQVYKKDANNSYTIHKTIDNKLEFIKKVNGVESKLTSVSLSGLKRWQCINLFISIDDSVGTTMSYVINNNPIVTISNTDKTILSGNVNMYLHDSDNTKQGNCFIERNYLNKDKSFTSEEIEIILKSNYVGTNSKLLAINNEFANKFIPSGFILPNNTYKVVGQANLFINGFFTRLVQNCTFTTDNRENKVALVGNATLVRVD